MTHMESRRYQYLQLCFLSLIGCGFVPAAVLAGDDPVNNGRMILEEKCARCHAIGLKGESPHPQAPPFRLVVKRYPVEDLAEALAEGIVSGHPDMPVFTFAPPEINAILAYLDTLNEPDNGQ